MIWIWSVIVCDLRGGVDALHEILEVRIPHSAQLGIGQARDAREVVHHIERLVVPLGEAMKQRPQAAKLLEENRRHVEAGIVSVRLQQLTHQEQFGLADLVRKRSIMRAPTLV